MRDDIHAPSAPVNGDATTSRQKIRPHWKLQWLGRMIRLKNAGKFSPAAVDVAWAVAECFYEKPLAEVSCSFLAKKTGLSKRWAVHAVGELARTPDTVVVRQRGQWKGRVKSKYAMVLTPEDLGADAATMAVTGPVASDELWVNGGSPTRVNGGSPTRVNGGSPNYTNSPKQREGEVVSANAGRPAAEGGGRPRGGESAASDDAAPWDAVASGDARALAAAFEAFWAAYPRKEGRAAARKAFEAAVARGVSVETLIDGARRYAAAKANLDSNWLKFPATWLRDECWLEDPKPPRPKRDRAASKQDRGRCATELELETGMVLRREHEDDDGVKRVDVVEVVDARDDEVELLWVRVDDEDIAVMQGKRQWYERWQFKEEGARSWFEVVPAAGSNGAAKPKSNGKVGKSVWSCDSGEEGVVISEDGDGVEVRWLRSGTQGRYWRDDLSFKPIEAE
jgi:hypothetical protein